MFDAKGVEIGNISRFLDSDGIGATTLAFGLERLVMNRFCTSNIWGYSAFAIAVCGEKRFERLDELRRNTFVKAATAQCNPEEEILGNTLLPRIPY